MDRRSAFRGGHADDSDEGIILDQTLAGALGKGPHGAKMLQHDLLAARFKWIADAKTESERRQREQSDALAYVDHEGKTYDFHALRCQFVSDLGRAGVSLQEAQKLARHSDPRLTANHYTHLSVSDLSRSLGQLPSISKTKETAKATGTDATDPNPPPAKDMPSVVLQEVLQEQGAPPAVSMRQTGDSGKMGETVKSDGPPNKKPCKPLALQGLEEEVSGENGIRVRGSHKGQRVKGLWR